MLSLLGCAELLDQGRGHNPCEPSHLHGPNFHGSMHPRQKPWSHLMGVVGVVGFLGSKGSPSNACAKPLRGTEKAAEAPDSLVARTLTPPPLFKLVRNSGVASTSAVQPAGW